MDNGFLAGLMNLIETRPTWVVLAAFGFAFLESLAVVGLLVPGIVLLFIVGALVGFDANLFILVWLAAMLGALSGDLISYWVGRHFHDRIPGFWPFRRRPELFEGGKLLISKHGGKSIFMGRFIGIMRPVVPMLAGMLGLRPWVFVAFAVPAAILWAPVYLVPGMIFGASLDLAAELAGRLVLLLVLAVLGIWFVLWITRVVYEFTARRSGWWLKSLVLWTHRHPVAGHLVGDLFQPGRHQVISIALLGLLMMVALVTLVAVLIAAPLTLPAWDAELRVVGLAASLRSHLADPVFVVLVLAGDIRVLAPLALAAALLLLVGGRLHALRFWVAAVAGGWLLAEITAALMGLVVPVDATEAGLDEVPHRAFALASLIFGFFAVMVAKDLSARRRKWPYLATSVLLAVLGFAQFYLGQATLLGLLAAFALGLGWVALVGIAYRRRARPRTHPLGFALVLSLTFLSLAGVQVHLNYDDKMSTSRVSLPERQLDRQHWKEAEWQQLPQRRSVLGSYRQQRFDLQLEADFAMLRAALLSAGWRDPPTGDLVSVLRHLAAAPDGEAPTLPRDFAGRPEDLLMGIDLADDERIVLRLWDSGARLLPGAVPLSLGQVRHTRLVPGPLGLRRWKEIAGTRAEAMNVLLEALPEVEVVDRTEPMVLLSLRPRSEWSLVRPAASGLPAAAADR